MPKRKPEIDSLLIKMDSVKHIWIMVKGNKKELLKGRKVPDFLHVDEDSNPLTTCDIRYF